MPKTSRAAEPSRAAEERVVSVRESTDFIECAVWSLAGLTVAVSLIAHGWLLDIVRFAAA